MEITQILKKPIITEKTYKMMEMNQFVFVIDNKATKIMVKNAFEIIFNKKVDSVNLIKKKAQKKRVGRFTGKTKRIKKAIITLKIGEEFSFFDKEQQDKIASVVNKIKSKKQLSKQKLSKITKEEKPSTGIANKFKSYWKSFVTLDTTTKKKDKK